MDGTFLLAFSGVLVLLMIFGFAFFEAGLVRARNTNDILIKNIAAIALGCLTYLLVSCHLLDGTGSSFKGLLPDLSLAFEKKVSFSVHTFYQLMLAILSVAIVIGATAERLRLWPYLVFVIVMVSFIYPIQAFWVWGDGFLKTMGFIDQAGAGVVHLTGACASLSCVLLLGPRFGKYTHQGKSLPLPGANIPLSVLGALLIWLGSFGFNGGAVSGLFSLDGGITLTEVLLNTMVVGSTGIMITMIFSRLFFGTVDITLILNGAIVALVSLSAAPHLLELTQAISLSMIAAFNMMIMMYLLDKWRIDDPVGAITVHGIGGITGLLGVAFMLPGGNWKIQLLGVAIIMAWSFVTSLLVWFAINLLMGLRIRSEDEYKGLDVVGCGMTAYPEFTTSGWEK